MLIEKNKYTNTISRVALCTRERQPNGKRAAIESESLGSISKSPTMALRNPEQVTPFSFCNIRKNAYLIGNTGI